MTKQKVVDLGQRREIREAYERAGRDVEAHIKSVNDKDPPRAYWLAIAEAYLDTALRWIIHHMSKEQAKIVAMRGVASLDNDTYASVPTHPGDVPDVLEVAKHVEAAVDDVRAHFGAIEERDEKAGFWVVLAAAYMDQATRLLIQFASPDAARQRLLLATEKQVDEISKQLEKKEAESP
jgi:hypothetical protein